MHDTSVQFGPFTLHPTQGLTRDGVEIRVTPKSLAVLGALASRPGSVVSKSELFRTVWQNSVVTDAALSTCIRELRRALQDDARQPRYIETLHRRGFRLLANTTSDGPSGSERPPEHPLPNRPMVGRAQALNSLVRSQTRILSTGAAVVVVRGADGVGKTTLVDHLLTASATDRAWAHCRVTSRDEHDRGDPYRPLLELLLQLLRRSGHPDPLPILRSCAPAWLAELPGVLNDVEQLKLQQRTSGTTTARRFREFADALAAFAAHAPLVVWFEDLPDLDDATIEWLEFFARERSDAPIMVIVTCTPDLACEETIQTVLESSRNSVIELQPLDHATTAALIAERLGDAADWQPSAGFEAAIWQQTGGLPFLLSGILDEISESDHAHSLQHRALARLDAPTRVSSMLERRIVRLDDRELQALEAASVAGARFTAAEVAAACDVPMEAMENSLIRLCDAAFVRPRDAETWPDGTMTRAFEFSHCFIRSCCYERIPSPRRAALHRRIGHRLQTAWREHSRHIASTLAMHFERAGEFERAVTFLYEAGATARRRNANGIAIRHFQRALALLESWSDDIDRAVWEADLSAALGREFVATEGLRSESGNRHYARALKLQAEIGMDPRLGRTLWMLWVFHLNRGPLGVANELARTTVRLAQEADDPPLLLEAHHAQWVTSLMQGELISVLDHTRQGIGLCGGRSEGSLAMTTGCTLHDVHLSDHHAAICAGFFSAWADVLGNRQDVAMRSLNAAIAHARDIEHPFTLAVTLTMSAGVLAAGGDAGRTRHHAQEGRRLAETHGFVAVDAWASVYEGWAATRLGEVESGLARMRHGLDAGKQLGMSLFRPFQLALAADAHRLGGRVRDAEADLAEAFAIAEQVGDRLATAELHRIRGELYLATGGRSVTVRRRARAEIEKAREIATAQGASLLVARADQALARIDQLTNENSRPRNGSRDARG